MPTAFKDALAKEAVPAQAAAPSYVTLFTIYIIHADLTYLVPRPLLLEEVSPNTISHATESRLGKLVKSHMATMPTVAEPKRLCQQIPTLTIRLSKKRKQRF